jgi:multiple sugar transport system permease protein
VAWPRSVEARFAPAVSSGYLFVAPALLLLVVFLVVPAISAFLLSLYRWDLISSNPTFVGAANFERLLLRDTLWWQSVWQTVYFVGVSVPLGMALALLLAAMLHARLPGRGLLRAAIFSPYVTPPVATISIWAWMFNADYGLVNSILAVFHLPKLGWLITPEWIMPAIIIYSIWSYTGLNFVLFLAGLSNIPAELTEAARVDGATAWQGFWRVTWPLLTPTTYFVLIISVIGSFKVFNVVYLFTVSGSAGATGGPNHAASTIGFYLWQEAFQFYHAGYAGAISVLFFVFLVALTLVQTRMFSGRVFYR